MGEKRADPAGLILTDRLRRCALYPVSQQRISPVFFSAIICKKGAEASIKQKIRSERFHYYV